MKNRANYFTAVITSLFLLLLMINGKTATAGVTDGIDICMRVIIPSLFPYFVVTAYLNENLLGCSLPGMQCTSKMLRIPNGCQMLLPLGLIGGYPVGAKLIAELYKSKSMDKQTAHILMGYCNNAGPAFIFGIAGATFSSPLIAVLLWIIHITSAIITGILLPKPNIAEVNISTHRMSLPDIIKNSVSAMASVCSWIIIFKVLLSYLNQWIPSILQSPAGILLTGFLELSNGCISASQLSAPATKFIVYAIFFGFGGLCVLLQTVSVTGDLGIGLYFHGKIIQTCISFILALVTSTLLFADLRLSIRDICLTTILSAAVIILTLQNAKKCGNPIHNHV